MGEEKTSAWDMDDQLHTWESDEPAPQADQTHVWESGEPVQRNDQISTELEIELKHDLRESIR